MSPSGWNIVGQTSADTGVPRPPEDDDLAELPPSAVPGGPVEWFACADELEQNLAGLEDLARRRNGDGQLAYPDLAAEMDGTRWQVAKTIAERWPQHRRPPQLETQDDPENRRTSALIARLLLLASRAAAQGDHGTAQRALSLYRTASDRLAKRCRRLRRAREPGTPYQPARGRRRWSTAQTCATSNGGGSNAPPDRPKSALRHLQQRACRGEGPRT